MSTGFIDINEIYRKYKKYKHKYQRHRKEKSVLYLFVVEDLDYDTYVIIVSALNEIDALNQLDKLDNNSKIYNQKSKYGFNANIDDLKKTIFKYNIKPQLVNTPMMFDL